MTGIFQRFFSFVSPLDMSDEVPSQAFCDGFTWKSYTEVKAHNDGNHFRYRHALLIELWRRFETMTN